MDATIHADPAPVWLAWRPHFEIRPADEEARNLNLYDLAYGLKIPVTLVAVNEMPNWTVEHSLPRGKLVIDHWMAALGEDRVRVGQEIRRVWSDGDRLSAPRSQDSQVLATGLRSAGE